MKKTLNNNERRKIAIFGLSANPPSGKSGHLGIVEYLASTQLFDEIWILPVYSHALVAKRSLEPYHHRIEMCRLNFEQLSTSELPIKVSELEMELHSLRSPHIIHEQELVTIGTVDMIHHIQSYNPSLDLHLVLGTDTFNDLANGKWKESERLHICIFV
jgi:nicotinic acid mononucleotide adenylyltransferase